MLCSSWPFLPQIDSPLQPKEEEPRFVKTLAFPAQKVIHFSQKSRLA
jgi:hypothetical protein